MEHEARGRIFLDLCMSSFNSWVRALLPLPNLGQRNSSKVSLVRLHNFLLSHLYTDQLLETMKIIFSFYLIHSWRLKS